MGKLLFAFGDWGFTEYGARVASLEGLRRATIAVVAMRHWGVSSDQISGELAEKLRNPYTGEPFTWSLADHGV